MRRPLRAEVPPGQVLVWVVLFSWGAVWAGSLPCMCVCVRVCKRVRECSRSPLLPASASARALVVGFVMMVGLLMAFGEGDLGLRSKTLINDVYDVMAFIKESVYVWDVAAVCFHTLSGPLILPPWVALLPPKS